MSEILSGAPELASQPFAQTGYDFMGACFEMHRVLGGGLLEEIYQESLELELLMRHIPFVPKQELALFYKEHQLKKRYIPDLVVASHLVVELKAVKQLIPDHDAQLLNYMRITRQPVGYLVNFAPIAKVEWKRLVISDFVATRENFDSVPPLANISVY
jgi:GxxExxY protein